MKEYTFFNSEYLKYFIINDYLSLINMYILLHRTISINNIKIFTNNSSLNNFFFY